MVVKAHLSMVKQFLEFPECFNAFWSRTRVFPIVFLAMLLNVHEYQVIQSDLFYPLVGGHQQPLKGVTFSPSQKGHKELPGVFASEFD